MKTHLKKIFLLIVVVMTAMVCFTFSASAETDGYYTYSVSNNEATIVSVDSSISGDVLIPSTLGGYRVTVIGKEAFSFNKNITDITIPDNVTTIGAYAFNSCYGLTSVKIGDGVTSIGEEAFENCTNLASIIIGESVTSIGVEAFDDCCNLVNVIIPNSVNIIGNGAFSECYRLTSITMGKSVTSIGNYAFAYCDRLTDVYYMGTREQWNGVAIGTSNSNLTGATIHYHSHAYSGVKTVPTCTDKGYTTFTCVCGESYVSDYVNALGHSGGKVTCTSKAKCSRCQQYYGNLKDHTYTTTTTKATLKKNGKTVSKCNGCGNEKTTVIYYPKTIKLSATTYTYNGKTKTPSVTVKDSKGNKLKSGTDYTVTYPKKRKSVGKYTVTVTFKGNYSGTKKLTFEIVPAKVSISKVSAGKKQLTATWKTVSGATGYEVVYSTSKKFTKKTTKTVTIKKAKTKKTTIKKLKKGKKYYVKVRAYKTVGKNKLYGAWSSVKNVKVK